jgi:hypothetical protein
MFDVTLDPKDYRAVVKNYKHMVDREVDLEQMDTDIYQCEGCGYNYFIDNPCPEHS